MGQWPIDWVVQEQEVYVMEFYLVRHAHADWSPNEDRPLSERGHREAQVVADRLISFPICGVISSPYRRAFQTVEPLAERKDQIIAVRSAFRERTLGSYSTGTFEEAVRKTWEDLDFAHPGGETNREAQRRAVKGIHELVNTKPGGPLVIGTHGNLLALILNHYDRSLGYDFWSRLTMPDIYYLEVAQSRAVKIERIWSE
jgi:2,3-bisphosphoglycerate-dependent phosphoglycerate mutase